MSLMRRPASVSVLACFLLVALRMSIGWQFMYEGLWKLNTLQTTTPWTSEGYLKNSRGPFRDHFRNIVADPDGLQQLDYAAVSTEWSDWYERFQRQLPDLTEQQKQAFDLQWNGPGEWSVPLAELPTGYPPERLRLAKEAPDGSFIRWDAERKRLVTNIRLLPAERDSILKSASENPAEGEPELINRFKTAVNKLYDVATSKPTFRERLEWLLKADRDRIGYTITTDGKLTPGTGSGSGSSEGVAETYAGEVAVYRRMLRNYERDLQAAKTSFQQTHLAKSWSEIQQKRTELVGPVAALTKEFQDAAYKILTPEQLPRGTVPEPFTQLSQANLVTIYGLIIVGLLLISGLFSRLAALAGAALMILFYLPYPPFPGVPEPPGPEHSLIVNKNFIEALALLALASLPTGQWFGIDSLIRWLLLGGKEIAKEEVIEL